MVNHLLGRPRKIDSQGATRFSIDPKFCGNPFPEPPCAVMFFQILITTLGEVFPGSRSHEEGPRSLVLHMQELKHYALTPDTRRQFLGASIKFVIRSCSVPSAPGDGPSLTARHALPERVPADRIPFRPSLR